MAREVSASNRGPGPNWYRCIVEVRNTTGTGRSRMLQYVPSCPVLFLTFVPIAINGVSTFDRGLRVKMIRQETDCHVNKNSRTISYWYNDIYEVEFAESGF